MATAHLESAHPDKYQLTTAKTILKCMEAAWEYWPTDERIMEDHGRFERELQATVKQNGVHGPNEKLEGRPHKTESGAMEALSAWVHPASADADRLIPPGGWLLRGSASRAGAPR